MSTQTETTPVIRRNGYFVEVAQGGPWLAEDGSVTLLWDKRGVWDTAQEAQQALDRSLHVKEP